MQNPFEKGPEQSPTKEEVMQIILEDAGFEERISPVILRELTDENGLRLLEIKIESEEPGETIEYLYTRKETVLPENLPKKVETFSTSIEVSYYQDGEITGGDRVAIYNSETGEWEKVST